MRKLFFIIIAFASLKIYTQTSDSLAKAGLPTKVCGDLKKRKLYFNCTEKYHPDLFVELCRTTKDRKVQETYYRYISAERTRKNLLTGSVVCLAGAGACFVGGTIVFLAAFGDANLVPVAGYVYIGGLAALATTVSLAVLCTGKNIKKKKILYKEMPEAYNFYANQN